ncbi:hypothetical protein DPMN_098690 [Dreissena polymorpha]|uniref:Uncharacterized protein n=1 Tax=Dreissena polymorpha TaxID=45954 RepID=A0A9D4R7I4_DREPO|nr:hypothetical protein DPMN_098690 [Dreissena polymorpha]
MIVRRAMKNDAVVAGIVKCTASASLSLPEVYVYQLLSCQKVIDRDFAYMKFKESPHVGVIDIDSPKF